MSLPNIGKFGEKTGVGASCGGTIKRFTTQPPPTSRLDSVTDEIAYEKDENEYVQNPTHMTGNYPNVMTSANYTATVAAAAPTTTPSFRRFSKLTNSASNASGSSWATSRRPGPVVGQLTRQLSRKLSQKLSGSAELFQLETMFPYMKRSGKTVSFAHCAALI